MTVSLRVALAASRLEAEQRETEKMREIERIDREAKVKEMGSTIIDDLASRQVLKSVAVKSVAGTVISDADYRRIRKKAIFNRTIKETQALELHRAAMKSPAKLVATSVQTPEQKTVRRLTAAEYSKIRKRSISRRSKDDQEALALYLAGQNASKIEGLKAKDGNCKRRVSSAKRSSPGVKHSAREVIEKPVGTPTKVSLIYKSPKDTSDNAVAGRRFTLNDLAFDAASFLEKNCSKANKPPTPLPPTTARVSNAEQGDTHRARIDSVGSTQSTQSACIREYAPGEIVNVLFRPGKGPNKFYGVGSIIEASKNAPDSYHVKFFVGGRDKCVPAKFIEIHIGGDKEQLEQARRESIGETCGADSFLKRQVKRIKVESHALETPAAREVLTPRNVEQSVEHGGWVRRSCRGAGKQQLFSSRVTKLLIRLRRNDPEDAEMHVLRLKNHIDSNSNKMVMNEVLKALEVNDHVQALYAQNMEEAMDDEMLAGLTQVLQKKKIWALNVGENFGISQKGWELFANALSNTFVTHIYAGSETTVNGALKIRMRDAVRANRVKHKLHNSPSNFAVINQIGQMWWNPRNSSVFSGKDGPAEIRLRPFIGRKVSIFHQGLWRLGRIVKFDEDLALHLIAWQDVSARNTLVSHRGAWLSLAKSAHLLSERVAWAQPPPDRAANIKAAFAERGSGETVAGAETKSKSTSLRQVCRPLMTELCGLFAARYFLKPVDWERAGLDDYPIKVERRIGLLTVRTKLNKPQHESYACLDQFAADLRLPFENHLRYIGDAEDSNPAEPLKRWATELLALCNERIESIRKEHGSFSSSSSCLSSSSSSSSSSSQAVLPRPRPIPAVKKKEPTWEPVHVFRHTKTMPKELEEEKTKDDDGSTNLTKETIEEAAAEQSIYQSTR